MEEYLKQVEVYFDWDYQIASCENIAELNNFEVHRAIQGFNFLKKILGIAFPKEALEFKHPICKYFLNKAPWTRVWFTWVADCIKDLSEAANFANVMTKFRSANEDDFAEALSLLEYGFKLHNAGFIIDFEQSILNNKGANKNPDIKLTNPITKEIIYCEISRLTNHKEIEKYSEITQNLHLYGLQRGKLLSYSGRLYKKISDEHLSDIYRKIKQEVDKVINNEGFKVIIEEGTLELAIATDECIHFLDQWSKEKNYNIGSFQLPTMDFFGRMVNKIIHKSKQASSNHCNIVIIKNEDLFTLFSPPEQFIAEVEETVYKCPDILAVIIIDYEGGDKETKVKKYGMSFYVERTERYALSSHNYIIINKYYKKTPITMFSLTKIIESFDESPSII